MEEVAGKEFVIDFTNLEDWQTVDFYDYFHMTPLGAKKLGVKLYDELINRKLVK